MAEPYYPRPPEYRDDRDERIAKLEAEVARLRQALEVISDVDGDCWNAHQHAQWALKGESICPECHQWKDGVA